MLKRIFYCPGDWLVSHMSARDRRAIATWLAIIFLVSIPIQYPFKNSVALVWLLSEIALVLSMLGVVSAETPVEEEEVQRDDVNSKV